MFHTYQNYFSYDLLIDNPTYLQTLNDNWIFLIISNSLFSVDNFFLIRFN